MPAHAQTDTVRVLPLIAAVLAGMAYFHLHEQSAAWYTATRLPDALYTFWFASPLLGGWLIGGVGALISHWAVALVVGLLLAMIVRRDFWLYGAIAVGASLTTAWLVRLDGWFSVLQFGPGFWLSMRAKWLTVDPIGVLSALLAMPLCTAWWGRVVCRRAVA
ncbi:MAG: hypothetical protein AAF610_01160 [Pseudomonadota bacterium]